jgi:sialate O-acetylesterase
MKMKINLLKRNVALALGIFASSQFAQAGVITDVSEFNSFSQIYQLDIPTVVDYNGSTPGYNVNNSGAAITGGIDRIGYYMELQQGNGERQWIWASFDTFTQDLSQIGVPVLGNSVWDQTLSNMTVESNVNGIVTGSGINTGNIEFWHHCYGTANDSLIPNSDGTTYDTDDSYSGDSCYGSMQIHNFGADQTLFAWNRWARGDAATDLGIGNNIGSSGQSDWTFQENAGSYSLKSLEVWVQPTIRDVPEPTTLAIFALGMMGLASRRFKKNS